MQGTWPMPTPNATLRSASVEANGCRSIVRAPAAPSYDSTVSPLIEIDGTPSLSACEDASDCAILLPSGEHRRRGKLVWGGTATSAGVSGPLRLCCAAWRESVRPGVLFAPRTGVAR